MAVIVVSSFLVLLLKSAFSVLCHFLYEEIADALLSFLPSFSVSATPILRRIGRSYHGSVDNAIQLIYIAKF